MPSRQGEDAWVAGEQKAHVSAAIRQYLGHSRGHWEGDTLVVETTNFDASANQIGRCWSDSNAFATDSPTGCDDC